MAVFGLASPTTGGIAVLGGSTAGTSPNTEYQQIVYSYFEIVYVLATNPLKQTYRLVRLEIDDVLVYDAEEGNTSLVGFRFYDGTQTAVDPVVRKYVGENAGAHQGDILLVLPKAEYTSPPSVRAVISNTAELVEQDSAPVSLEYVGTPLANSTYYAERSYDPTTGLLYQHAHSTDFNPDAAEAVLVVLDVAAGRELRRTVWGGPRWPNGCIVLPSTDLMFCSSWDDDFPVAVDNPNFLIDTRTGEVLDTIYATDQKHMVPLVAVDAGHVETGHWIVIASQYDGDFGGLFVVDAVGRALELYEFAEYPAANCRACRGRRRTGSASVFMVAASDDRTIVEVIWGGADEVILSNLLQLADTHTADGVAYDPLTGYLVVPQSTGTVHSILVVNPKDGTVVQTISSSVRLVMESEQLDQSLQMWAKPGHVLLPSDSTLKVYDLDLSTMVLSVWADNSIADVPAKVYDQTREWWLYDDYPGGTTLVWKRVGTSDLAVDDVPVQTLIETVMEIAGYNPDDLSFEGFDETLVARGYVIGGSSTTIDVLDTLADIYDFVYADSGEGYYFRKIDKSGTVTPDGTVDEDDLVDDGMERIVTSDRADSQTIYQIDAEFISVDNEYNPSNVADTRPKASFEVTRSARKVELDLPIVDTDARMQKLVTQRLYQAVAGARQHSAALPPDFAHFLPGDVVQLESGGIEYTTQLVGVTVTEQMVAHVEAVDISTDVQVDVSSASNSPFLPSAVGSLATIYVPLDLPLLDYSHDGSGDYLASYGLLAPLNNALWPGGTLYRASAPGALGWAYTQAPMAPVNGWTLASLAPPSDNWVRDDDNSLVVTLAVGELESTTESGVLNNWQNMAAVGAPGRWEILAFEDAVDNEDGTWTLSHFTFRGWGGTEVHQDSHQIGDRFVLLDPAWVRLLTNPVGQLGEPEFTKAVTAGHTGLSSPTTSHTVSGVAETPFAVVNVADEDDAGDTVVTWDYRSRLDAWEFFEAVPDSSGEETLEFEVDVMDGDDVVNTYTVTEPEWTYTAAEKTADWGTPPATAMIRIFMMSAVVGRGHMAEAEIDL